MENNTNFQTFHQMGAAINDFVKQATGRDNVQNIDMEHITVAQNHYYQDVDVSGSVVSFHAGAAGLPLEKCVVQIKPVQDLHGYDHPWPGGATKNKMPKAIPTTVTDNGITCTVNNNGVISVKGTATADAICYLKLDSEFVVPSGDPAPKLCLGNSVGNNGVQFLFYRDNTQLDDWVCYPSNRVQTYILLQGKTCNAYAIGVNNEATVDMTISPMMVENSVTNYTYIPYSNICPITGWTGANVYVSPTTDAADGQTYTIAFPSEAGTVYGGTLTINGDGSGELAVNRRYFTGESVTWTKTDDYNYGKFYTNIVNAKYLSDTPTVIASQYKSRSNSGETGTTTTEDNYCWIRATGTRQLRVKDDSKDALTAQEFKEAMTGVQFVYELVTPVVFSLTAQQISTLLGINNVWADTGDIEVKFKDLKELY